MAVNGFWIDGDSLYFYGAAFNYVTYENEITFGIVNVKTRELVSNKIITDGTESEIVLPYGIMVNPVNKDIYITDAGDYVNPGTLYCYGKDGVRKWSTRTGDIPGAMAFLIEKK